MIKDQFINRLGELKIFRDILTSEVKTRILLISGESGMGKTTLLRKFADICAQEKILTSTYDYKGGGGSPLTQLTRHIIDLGTNSFDLLRHSYADVGIQVSEFKTKEIFSSTDIQYALTGLDLVNRFSTLSEITSSFAVGLRKVLQHTSPIVFFLDKIEATGPLTEQWLVNDFFRIANENRGVIIIASGQTSLELPIEIQEFSTHIKLEGIDFSEWEAYAKRLSIELSSDFIHSAHYASKGNPTFMKQVLIAATGARK